jgi:hypothetical protein
MSEITTIGLDLAKHRQRSSFAVAGHCRREFARALLREFGVHTDPYAHLSLHRRDQGWRLRSRRKCSL